MSRPSFATLWPQRAQNFDPSRRFLTRLDLQRGHFGLELLLAPSNMRPS